MSDSWQPEPSPWLSPASRPADDDPPPPAANPAPPSATAALPTGLVPVSAPVTAPPPQGYGQSSQPSVSRPPAHYGYSDTLSATSDPMATQMVSVGTVQPRTAQPAAGGSVEVAERILGQAVDALGSDSSAYSIGGAADGAVCLVPEDGRWSVFLADGGARRFAGSFDDPEQAAVHFAGVLLLVAAERGTLPKASQRTGSELGPGSDPLAALLAGPPIEPLAGDPPSSLYTDRRLMVLTPGTEVDRFGDQEGNTVYVARTRYPFRSLPPDFVDREYRVYRVRDPLRAVAGTAVPWFGQPGGGTAYLLPRSIRDLMREGVLVEVPAATVAPF